MDNQTAPYSQESEEAVLGAILVNPRALIPIRAWLTSEHFFFVRHRYIYDALLALHDAAAAIDYVTVVDRLQSVGQLDAIGGPAYITQLISFTPTSIHAEHYARIVERTAVRRQLMEQAEKIRALAADQSKTLPDVVDEATALFTSATAPTAAANILTLEEGLQQNFAEVERAYQEYVANPTDNDILGYPCGIANVDAFFKGFRKGEVYLWAGRTHMGKTGAMLTVALGAARMGARVAFINVSDGDEASIINRLISMEINMPADHIQHGRFKTPEQYRLYVEAIGRLSNLKLYVYHELNIPIAKLRNKVRALQHEHGLDMVCIDYMQRIAAPEIHGDTFKEINYVSKKLKELASSKEANVSLHVGAQLNRATGTGRPGLEHLKGSGNLEEDASAVVLLHRPGFYQKNADNPNKTEAIVPKNRANYRLGTVLLDFNPISGGFRDGSHYIEEEETKPRAARKIIPLNQDGRRRASGERDDD
jgi:replicative DNA helicase